MERIYITVLLPLIERRECGCCRWITIDEFQRINFPWISFIVQLLIPWNDANDGLKEGKCRVSRYNDELPSVELPWNCNSLVAISF